jgi:hypothetical protein
MMNHLVLTGGDLSAKEYINYILPLPLEISIGGAKTIKINS